MENQLYSVAAELYEVAFDWDITDEITWLLDRLGIKSGPLLEPGCGSGRFLEALGRRGVAAVGIDRSPQMVTLAHSRIEPWRHFVRAVEADMVDFELDQRFGGAFCPVNTVAYLRPDELVHHLETTATHLEPGSSYLVQLDLRDPDLDPRGSGSWTASRGETEVSVTWAVEECDLTRHVERQRARIEVTAGPMAGAVLDEVHVLTPWTAEQFATAVAGTPFEYHAAFDGNQPERPEVPVGTAGELLWHDLRIDSHA